MTPREQGNNPSSTADGTGAQDSNPVLPPELLDQVTDKVFTFLLRDLRIEVERKGLRRMTRNRHIPSRYRR